LRCPAVDKACREKHFDHMHLSQYTLLQRILHVPPAVENAVNIDIISEDLINDPVLFAERIDRSSFPPCAIIYQHLRMQQRIIL
jgi:hypothetical protein